MENYCVLCGEYIGENNKMYCHQCKEKYLKTEEKRLDKRNNLWYNIFKQLRKK